MSAATEHIRVEMMKKTDEIPQSIDSTNEIEKLARQNIKFSIEEDNDKNCKNPSEICDEICLIF